MAFVLAEEECGLAFDGDQPLQTQTDTGLYADPAFASPQSLLASLGVKAY